MRYLIGLTVSITGSSVERAKRFMEACKAAGAETVAAGYSERINGRFEGVWSEVWRQEVAEVL